jgi:hypothetical protein
MTIKYLAGNTITGLAADTKPTTALIQPGARFLETDTNQEYFWSGSEWLAKATDTPWTYTVYKAGTTVKAKNNTTGAIDYSGDATVDCSPTIQSAIHNVANVGSDAGDAEFGAGIFIKKGVYKCTTYIDASAANGVRNGIRLKGECTGGTVLSFEPVSTLLAGLFINQNFSSLSDLTFRGNTNIGNIVYMYTTLANRARNFTINNCHFEGPNAYPFAGNGTGEPSGSQIGLFQDGQLASWIYWWKITNCTFNALGRALVSFGEYGTSIQISNCNFLYCTTAIILIDSGQHTISNCTIQGDSNYGETGISIVTSTAASNQIKNVIADLRKTGRTNCQAVLLGSGTPLNVIQNVYNINENGSTFVTLRDNVGVNTTYNIANPQFYHGLSTDTKPTGTSIIAGSRFLATDTRVEYVYNGSTWSAMA